jgi:hypothetical protein
VSRVALCFGRTLYEGRPGCTRTRTRDDLTAARAAQVPGVLDYLTRKEAAAYTRRGLRAEQEYQKVLSTIRGRPAAMRAAIQ